MTVRIGNLQCRYYASSLGRGRFASPAPLPWIGWQHQGRRGEEQFLKFITNPQNLNQYAYVLNNPLNAIDPTGMLGCKVDGKDTECSIVVVYDKKTSEGTLYESSPPYPLSLGLFERLAD